MDFSVEATEKLYTTEVDKAEKLLESMKLNETTTHIQDEDAPGSHPFKNEILEGRLLTIVKPVCEYVVDKCPELVADLSSRCIAEETKNMALYKIMAKLVEYYNENEDKKKKKSMVNDRVRTIQTYLLSKKQGVFSDAIDYVLNTITRKIETGEVDEDGTIHITLEDRMETPDVMRQVSSMLNKENSLCTVTREMDIDPGHGIPTEWTITPLYI